MGNVEITKKRIMMMTRAMASTLITSIHMTIITMILTRAMAILPTKNSDVNGNSKDAYANV